ncbi:NAC domain-containing protein 78 [Triticum urartu]|uniref:NAC domain-containing protein 78 n=1 Tax=Triticum urartu TaxID=4572 RepID=M7ZFD3_TRIUA|nr:NAC domain-containing protein 78 [Triticum urartu]
MKLARESGKEEVASKGGPHPIDENLEGRMTSVPPTPADDDRPRGRENLLIRAASRPVKAAAAPSSNQQEQRRRSKVRILLLGRSSYQPSCRSPEHADAVVDRRGMAPVGLPPGFRFHPTDEELVNYYLKRKIHGLHIELDIIPEVDLYKCEPWDLAEKSFLPSRDPEWYFFGPRDRKYPNGFRTNRATRAGYWKSTGKDRRVMTQQHHGGGARAIGMKKTLVYYRGRAPQGVRTDWVMHEYRLDDKDSEDTIAIQDTYALCRVFKKNAICAERIAGSLGNRSIDAGLKNITCKALYPVNMENPMQQDPLHAWIARHASVLTKKLN